MHYCPNLLINHLRPLLVRPTPNQNSCNTHLEPVNGAAVNEGGETSQTVPKRVSDGTHGQHHMQLCATALYKHVEKGQGAAICLLVAVTLPVQHTHSLTDFLLLVNCKQVGHLETTKR